MNNELLTVEQFAKETRRTKSAIYQRLKTSLKDYIVIKGGKRYIKRAALSLLNTDADELQDNTEEVKENTEEDRQIEAEVKDENKDDYRALQGELVKTCKDIEYLQKELEREREANEELKRQLNEARATIQRKDEQLEAQAARLLSITENQQELLRNSQLLQAQAQTKRGFFARLFAPKDSTSK